MHIQVRLLDGELLEFSVPEDTATIGRSSKCKVVIPHDGVSRQHCIIEVVNGEIYVTDTESTNGVMIDGTKIPPNKKTNFKPYLPLSFGPVQSLLVTIEDERTLGSYDNPLLKGQMGDTSSRTQMMTKVPSQKTKPQPVQPTNSQIKAPARKNDNKIKFILATLLALLIVAGAWYLETSGETETAAPVNAKPGKVEYY